MATYLSTHACGVDVLAAGDDWGRPGRATPKDWSRHSAPSGSATPSSWVDAGSTLTPATVAALQASDLAVLVANPDVPCLRNLRRLTDAVRLSGVASDRLRVLLNRASEYVASRPPRSRR
jgi:Flp pilus assembly CpaE family ATPase